jgi:hypothetical protein
MQNSGPVAFREVLEFCEGNGEPSKTIERGDGRQWAGGDCEKCSRDAIAGHKNDFHFSGRPIDIVVHKQMADDVNKVFGRLFFVYAAQDFGRDGWEAANMLCL